MVDFITTSLLTELGFKLVKYNESDFQTGIYYGVAFDIKGNGITQINWCTGGHSVTYFGEKLEENISLSIKKDGGTRHAFNGYVFSPDDLKRVLKLTW